MNINSTNELFRLSAILYADNNYEVSPQTTHRKIIESAIFENGNKFISIPNLCNYINDTYELIFSEEEILNVIRSPKNSGFELSFFKKEQVVRLTQNRMDTLHSKIKNKTIDDYIAEFEATFNITAKEIIYRFLYELFSNDVGSFQRLINAKKQTSSKYRVDSQNYNESEKDIINNFLNWEQPQKDKAIFDISSYAIEYSILTNKNNSLSFQTLRNKQIYLDANVIYRALGINGASRETLTKTFLQKFNDVGEKLYISRFTETEFKDSIKFHIDNIRRFNNPRVSSSVYIENSINEDICNFYHKWRTGKVNGSTDLFLAYVYNLYDQFVDKFKIEIDRTCPYDLENEEIDGHLKEMGAQIFEVKRQQDNTAYENSAYIDAQNILWLETKRANKNSNIHETSYFLISTDQILRRWDYLRNDNVPIVLLPSQWLSIVLRFLNRTNNDYKSFVNFLNLRGNEQTISGERLQVILAGISEITADPGTQRNLMNLLVENKFKNIINGERDNDAIYEKARLFAQSETDKKIKELKQRQDELESMVSTMTGSIAQQKQTYQQEQTIAQEVIKNTEEELKATKTNLTDIVKRYNQTVNFGKSLYVRSQMKKWRFIWPSIMFLTFIFIIIYILFALFGPEKLMAENIVNIFNTIDQIPSDAGRHLLKGLTYSFVTGLAAYVGRLIYVRFVSKEKIMNKKTEFENSYFEKIKSQKIES